MMKLTKWLKIRAEREAAYLAACITSTEAWDRYDLHRTDEHRKAMMDAIRATDAAYLAWRETDNWETEP